MDNSEKKEEATGGAGSADGSNQIDSSSASKPTDGSGQKAGGGGVKITDE